MGLFSPYKQDGQPSPSSELDASASDPAGKKNRPTPSRKEAEAARRERLHPKLTKKQLKAQEREDRRSRELALEKARNEDPAQKLMRNYVDARWSIGEFAWPVLLILVALTLAAGTDRVLQYWITSVMWVFMAAAGVNAFLLWRGFKAELNKRYPRARTRGLAIALSSRMLTLRRFRQPGPAIPRGGEY